MRSGVMRSGVMTRPKVLVVDDDQDFAESLAEVLESRGHEVEVAFSGREAIDRFRNEDFGLVLMDVRLPGMNGVESFFELRNIKPDARVVMMTAFSVEQLVAEAIANGAFGVLYKPLDVEKLLELLEDVHPEGVILASDDGPDFVQNIDNILQGAGFSTIVAHTRDEAVDRVLSNGVDVLILDLKLPVLTGLEVYLELKKRGYMLPTIIVTGYPSSEQRDKGDTLDEVSVQGFLTKPFDPEQLLSSIRPPVGEAR